MGLESCFNLEENLGSIAGLQLFEVRRLNLPYMSAFISRLLSFPACSTSLCQRQCPAKIISQNSERNKRAFISVFLLSLSFLVLQQTCLYLLDHHNLLS